ncbi:hypothetical protein BDZ94DRAFT_1254630 [Collybia nuda]|uniref:Uncharacterized protein n=1 Tax=Collybia nuda TaxID=64659 RepID=A0A9P5YCH7_9AGAR|nr:hypothetical protein BDZ94DRAFT_1254630 [Collybia nuda]
MELLISHISHLRFSGILGDFDCFFMGAERQYMPNQLSLDRIWSYKNHVLRQRTLRTTFELWYRASIAVGLWLGHLLLCPHGPS